MSYKLTVSQEAYSDANEIVRYIALELKNKSAALDFLDDLERTYKSISENPNMYALCIDKRLSKAGYRKVAVKNYLVLYRADEVRNEVYVVRIIYGRRDYSRWL